MVSAPVALFVYNRPLHTRKTVDALLQNELVGETDIVIFCDGARNEEAVSRVQEVRRYVRTISGFRSVRIIEHENNLGLANSIISGVTEVCREFGRVIVLEDDLVTAPTFLRYMNDALNLYQDEARVGSIHGYWYPVQDNVPNTFFLRGASCWGWATWSRAWNLFEADGRKLLAELQQRKLTSLFDLDGAMAYTKMLKRQIAGKNNSWAIRWHASTFLANRLQLSPNTTFVRNIGFDASGVHCGETDAYDGELAVKRALVESIPIEESAEARAALIRYYINTRRSLPTRILSRIRRIIFTKNSWLARRSLEKRS